ncbi:MAG TPA: protease pro-enzyme activation domain-containing protein, partial [Acidimicrobiia bacterium]|nr:protease pro-enzyme activation domain-containing protein [Acidimicrobiia bacterium]
MPARRTVTLHGTTANFARAFAVEFVRRSPRPGVVYRGVRRAPTLPTPLAGKVVFVHGLVTHPPPAGRAPRVAQKRRVAVAGGQRHRDPAARRMNWAAPGKRAEVTLFVRSARSVAVVERFARNNELQVVDADRTRLQVVLRGRLEHFSRAFATQFVRLSVDGHRFRGVTRPATLPAAVARHVVFVFGLKTYPPRHSAQTTQPSARRASPAVAQEYAVSTHTVPGSSGAAPRLGAREVGAPPPDKEVRVTVVLRRRQEQNPMRAARASASHGQRSYLTRAEFARSYGASPDDIDAVQTFARVHNLRVTNVDAARRSIVVAGTAEAIAGAFGTRLARYEHEGRVYRGLAPGADVKVPAPLGDSVVAVLGLETFPVAAPRFKRHGGGAAFSPARLAKLYNFPAKGAPGQTIGIVEFGGGFRPQDITSYFQSLQLPVPRIVTVPVDGGGNHPTGDPDSADGEVCLDIEVAGAVAPKARIAVYFAPNTDRGFVDAVTTAIHDGANRPTTVSISWGNPETQWSAQTRTALNHAFQDAASLGVTITAASGDDGSSDGVNDGADHVDFPASSPFVLACGGTTLTAQGGSISNEKGWHGSGGGVSTLFNTPSWQQGANVPPKSGGGRGRGVPDVSGDADPTTGYRIRVGGQDVTLGGTSAVAPLWAGLVACLNAQLPHPAGFVNPVLYQQGTSTLRDITQGSNGTFHAHGGWDPVTGLGSPKGRAILRAMRGGGGGGPGPGPGPGGPGPGGPGPGPGWPGPGP